nr:MAG TPA: hypothetical protein [Bacteriophage sp.]
MKTPFYYCEYPSIVYVSTSPAEQINRWCLELRHLKVF